MGLAEDQRGAFKDALSAYVQACVAKAMRSDEADEPGVY